MTLLDEINALDAALVASRDTQAIADALSVGRVQVVPRQIGFGAVLDTLGDDAGALVLDTIDSLRPMVPKLKYVWVLLDKGELDVGMSSVRAGLDGLAAQGGMTEDQAGALKSLAEVPAPVSARDVELAMKNDDGTDK